MLNTVSRFFICFIEAFYIGNFMGYSLREIVKVPKNEKSTLIKFRIVSWIFVPAVLAISAISGYWLILN